MNTEKRMNDFYRGKKILVTGGAGAIGSNLTKKLVSFGSDVSVLDNLSSGTLKNIYSVESNVHFVNADIALHAVWQPMLPERFDLIFHLAAFFANQNSVDFPEQDLATNGMGTLSLCRWALDSGAGRLIFASSSCVYGDVGGAIDESAGFDPHTPYAITKILGEHYVDFHQEHYNLDTVVLRYFNSFGPGELPGLYRNVIPNFIETARNGEPLPLRGDGHETRDFTYVDDTVCGTLLAGMVPEASGGTFNIGSGRETHIENLAETINRFAGNKAGYEYLPRRDWDRVSRRCAIIDRARRVLGYEPSISLCEGIRRTCAWAEKMLPKAPKPMASAG